MLCRQAKISPNISYIYDMHTYLPYWEKNSPRVRVKKDLSTFEIFGTLKIYFKLAKTVNSWWTYPLGWKTVTTTSLREFGFMRRQHNHSETPSAINPRSTHS